MQHTVRKPSGWMVITPEFGQAQEFDTLKCTHCQHTWQVIPGSGKQRGWCSSCAGPTCGAELCETRCQHWEKQLEIIERNATRLLRLGV